MRKPTK